MPKDYKDAPAARAESRLAHPLLLGMIIGVLLGVVISLAVALWLNRLSNPFVEKGRSVEPVAKFAPAQPQPPAEAARAAEQAAKGKLPAEAGKPAAPKAQERPRFEFYQILPGEKEVTEKEAKAQASTGPRPPSLACPLTSGGCHPPRTGTSKSVNWSPVPCLTFLKSSSMNSS